MVTCKSKASAHASMDSFYTSPRMASDITEQATHASASQGTPHTGFFLMSINMPPNVSGYSRDRFLYSPIYTSVTVPPCPLI